MSTSLAAAATAASMFHASRPTASLEPHWLDTCPALTASTEPCSASSAFDAKYVLQLDAAMLRVR